MSEIRQDITTREWVIFAKERARRPDDFRRDSDIPKERRQGDACPFCPGNEGLTMAEVYRSPDVTSERTIEWGVRVVPNMFPALAGEGSLSRVMEGHHFHRIDGVGFHEVVIEGPGHVRFMHEMTDEEVVAIVNAYRARFAELRKDDRLKLILIFKNHGRAAGTSLQHPHSQIIASPVVPAYIRSKYELATAYYDDTERCIYCDVVHEEIALKKRIICSNESFVAFHPFASRLPFETWIAPISHRSSFGMISDAEAVDFARIMRVVLRQLAVGLGNPDFNYVIHTAPLSDENKPYYLWHMQILPRLVTQAGFELGSGMAINTALPEETAEFMRGIRA